MVNTIINQFAMKRTSTPQDWARWSGKSKKLRTSLKTNAHEECMKQQGREFDGRITLKDASEISMINMLAVNAWNTNDLTYLLVSGVERGDGDKNNEDMQLAGHGNGCYHVHIACVFNKTVYGKRVFDMFKMSITNGYYIRVIPKAERDQGKLKYSTWRVHHIKEATKINKGNLISYENGTLPDDKVKKVEPDHIIVTADGIRNMTTHEKDTEIIKMCKAQQWDELEALYPGRWLRESPKWKQLYKTQDNTCNFIDHRRCLWIHGGTGLGKSCIVEMFWPNNYKKRMDCDFSLYDPKEHDMMYFADMTANDVDGDRLTISDLKRFADPQGYNGNVKYMGANIIRCRVVITSNHTIGNIMPLDMRQIEDEKAAMFRRYLQINIKDYLLINGLQLKTKSELQTLQRQGNCDFKHCFIETEPDFGVYTREYLYDVVESERACNKLQAYFPGEVLYKPKPL